MNRPLALAGGVVVSAGLLAGTLIASLPAGASSHREAPMIAGDPYADLTDVYAFVSADKPDSVTLIMNAIPYEDPMGGPNYYQFDPKVRYQLHVAQAGHNEADITYNVEFQTTVKNPNTFLYQVGPYARAGDANLNVQQTATVTKNVRGVGESVIMRIGGWKTRSVFQRYDIVDNRDIAEAMRKLEHSEKTQFGHVSVTFGNSAEAQPTDAASKPVI